MYMDHLKQLSYSQHRAPSHCYQGNRYITVGLINIATETPFHHSFDDAIDSPSPSGIGAGVLVVMHLSMLGPTTPHWGSRRGFVGV